MNHGRVEYEFLWLIENFNYCWQKNGESVTSPDFNADELEGTSWRLSVYPKGETAEDNGYLSLYIGRNPVDDGPEEISLTYELTVFDQFKTTIHLEEDKAAFGKNKIYGLRQFAPIEKCFGDSLSVCCRIWKDVRKVEKVVTIRARTRFAFEKISFLHVVENFSTLEPNHKNAIEIQSESKNGVVVSSSLYINGDSCCEGDMIVEIAPSDSSHNLSVRKISLLHKTGNARRKYVCDVIYRLFLDERRDIKNLPLVITKQDILNEKNDYLPDDKLSLLCECIFSIGLEYEKIEGSYVKIPGAGIKQASDWIESGLNPMGKRLKLDFTDEDKGVGNISLEMSVENFSTTAEVASMFHGELENSYLFHVRVFAGNIEGWLAVFPEVKISHEDACDVYFTPSYLWWTVSIIDIEGDSRFPQYFEKYPHEGEDEMDQLREAKYLEKSFILDRADDLLSEETLRLRCDIRFDLDVLEEVWCNSSNDFDDFNYAAFLGAIPFEFFPTSESLARIFNLTSQVLDLSQFHESCKIFAIEGQHPASRSSSPESKEDSAEILKDVWLLETSPDRFLLSFARRPDNLGSFLLSSSPVFRQCIKSPMKERVEKCIDLSNVDSETFRMVLYFLESGKVPKCKYQDLVKVYEFSHLYLMENLQQRSAKCMVERCESDSLLEQIKSIADLYSDEYLLKLLEIRQLEVKHLRGELVIKEPGNLNAIQNRFDYDCYI